jgi:hypothetical protein
VYDLSKLWKQSQNADDDQVDRHDVIEHAGNNQNQNAREQGNEWGGGETDVHGDFRALLGCRIENRFVACASE